MKPQTCILTLFMLVLLSCSKEDPKIKKISSEEGVYIGNTYQLNKWANPMDGYNERDTTFIDTFFVSFLGEDSIQFANKGGEWSFMLDKSKFYREWYGSHSNKSFEFKDNDSLAVSYWLYGGAGSSFNQLNIDFEGVKQ